MDDLLPRNQTMKRDVLLVFTRFPEAGEAKTRLIPHLGAEGAAEIQEKMTLSTLKQVRTFPYRNLSIEIYFTGASLKKMQAWVGKEWNLVPQAQGTLGQKLKCAFRNAFAQNARKVVAIGTDCPFLKQSHFKQAFDALHRTPLVVGPARDGGYYLIGMREPLLFLFEEISWGTNRVLQQTLETAKGKRKPWTTLEVLSDIDRPEDLSKLPKHLLGEKDA